MQRSRHNTRYPAWMRLAVHLAGWVTLALFLPLVLGILLDKATGMSPLGLLLGMIMGMSLAIIIVLVTIRKQIFVLSPIIDAEDHKESL